MSFSEARVKRASAGTPKGGQFESFDQVRPEVGQLVDVFDGTGGNTPISVLSDEDLVLHARQWSQWIMRRNTGINEDASDLEGEIVEEMMKKRLSVMQRASEAQANGTKVPSHVEKAYIKKVARSKLTEISAGHQVSGKRIHPTERMAYAAFRKQEQEAQNLVGRSLTEAEKERLAQKVDGELSQRPAAGWYERLRAKRTPYGVGGTSEWSEVESVAEVSPIVTAPKPADAEVKRHLRSTMWDALSDGRDIPALKSLDKDEARRATRAVNDAGGVRAVARGWATGELAEDSAAVKGLLAPWGSMTRKQEEDVVGLLNDHPDYANDLWKSALRP